MSPVWLAALCIFFAGSTLGFLAAVFCFKRARHQAVPIGEECAYTGAGCPFATGEASVPGLVIRIAPSFHHNVILN